jgi:hypothetical protein
MEEWIDKHPRFDPHDKAPMEKICDLIRDVGLEHPAMRMLQVTIYSEAQKQRFRRQSEPEVAVAVRVRRKR